MSWLSLALLSSVGLGLYDVSKKAALEDNAVLQVLVLSTLSGLALLLLELLLGPWLARSGLSLALVELSARQHGLVLLKSAIVSASWIFSYFAIKHLPISLASPIRAGAPVFTVLGALLLFEERPGALQWLGIAIVVLAYFAFSLIGKGEGIDFARNRWVGALFIGTLIGAGSGLYDKYLLQVEALPPFTLQCWFTLYGLLIQLSCWAAFRGLGLVPRERVKLRWTIPLLGGLLVVADQLYFEALAVSGALVSVVSVLRRTNVIVSFSVGSVLFRESRRREKALALGGVLVGLWLLLKS